MKRIAVTAAAVLSALLTSRGDAVRPTTILHILSSSFCRNPRAAPLI